MTLENALLSVLVAAFNEEDTIEKCVRAIFAAHTGPLEVLVVDGGTDSTGEVVNSIAKEFPGLRYVHNENDRGKGHAIQTGISEARGEIMAQIDADLQFRPDELSKLAAPIMNGEADVVLGSRFMSDSRRNEGSTPPFRTWGNKTASLYASILFGHRMTDVQAGMKAWTAEAIKAVQLRSDNYSYEVEIPVKALRRGYRVMDVPITTDARQGGETCVNAVTDGIVLLWDITMFRLGLR